MDLRLGAATPATEDERAAVASVLGPPGSGWEGGDRTAADGHAAFGGHAAPCLQHGGDLAGCEPCPASLHALPDPGRFVTGMEGIADPGFFLGIFAPAPAPPSGVTYVAADEETAAAGQIAKDHATPFIAFRAISDGTADPLMLPGFPAQFFVYKQLAADNAAAMTLAFVRAWT